MRDLPLALPCLLAWVYSTTAINLPQPEAGGAGGDKWWVSTNRMNAVSIALSCTAEAGRRYQAWAADIVASVVAGAGAGGAEDGGDAEHAHDHPPAIGTDSEEEEEEEEGGLDSDGEY